MIQIVFFWLRMFDFLKIKASAVARQAEQVKAFQLGQKKELHVANIAKIGITPYSKRIVKYTKEEVL